MVNDKRGHSAWEVFWAHSRYRKVSVRIIIKSFTLTNIAVSDTRIQNYSCVWTCKKMHRN